MVLPVAGQRRGILKLDEPSLTRALVGGPAFLKGLRLGIFQPPSAQAEEVTKVRHRAASRATEVRMFDSPGRFRTAVCRRMEAARQCRLSRSERRQKVFKSSC